MDISYNLKLKADKLFWIFEEYFFENSGNYPRKTNLVLEFADFIANASREELEKYIKFNSNNEFKQLKFIISQGVDCWLDNGDIKTLLL